MSTFDPIVTRSQIALVTEYVLGMWLPTYIAEVERQNVLEPEELPLPVGYMSRTSFSQWTEEEVTPVVLIVSPGLVSPRLVSPGPASLDTRGEPSRDGEGVWRAVWQLSVGVIVSGEDPVEIQRNADLYASAIRACLLQRQPLPGLDGRLRWTGETYVGIPDEQSLTTASARVDFDCLIPSAVSDQAGPAPDAEPPEDPYELPEDRPTVETTHLTVDPLEET